ncbi:MAG: glutathione S-transferase family protein [Candidatus Cloacimonetes bacterium]|nr:glutathione S-transferase family protein [Candidatus Cloacimonadota bacterium]
MIKLYGFGESFSLPDSSPFVLKVHAYLKMVGIEYTCVSDFKNLQTAPKGKLPYIEDGDKTVSDSSFIIDYLKDTYKVDLDSHLSTEEKSLGYLIAKSLDENLYWCIVYSRWISEESWPTAKKVWFDKMDFPLRYIVPIVARRGVRDKLKKHGIGLHSESEILKISNLSLQALSGFLNEKQFILGDKVSSLDANVYAHLAQFILSDLDNKFTKGAKQHKNLVDYCHRFQSLYFK